MGNDIEELKKRLPPVYAVYVKDLEGIYLAKKFYGELVDDTFEMKTKSLDELQELFINMGLVKLMPMEGDAKSILETWM